MFKNVLEKIVKWINGPTYFDNLEAHIVAGNPQSAHDVEMLERGFYERHRRSVLWLLEK